MPALTFKQKLVLSMMVVVSGITLAMLYIAERQSSQEFEARFRQEFEAGFKLFNSRQAARLGVVKTTASELGAGVRLMAVLLEAARDNDEGAAEIAYEVIRDQRRIRAGRLVDAGFERLYDPKGRMFLDEEKKAESEINEQLKRLNSAIAAENSVEVGYIALKEKSGTNLYEVYLTKIRDAVGSELRGTLLFASPFEQEAQQGGVVYGLWVEGKLQVAGVPEVLQAAVRSVINDAGSNEGRAEAAVDGKRYLIFYRALNAGSHFPPAFQVSVQSLEPMFAAKQAWRAKIFLTGAVALGFALVLSIVLAAPLTAGVERLAAATHEIERGNFEVKLPVQTGDEVGRLTESFNDMAAGLLLREKYRSVLDMVADKKIAEDLIHGQIELGGEERQVSVLFCDIRGFTALTEHMEPKEVIEMLNQHFTPLTRIVYDYHGAVDKFVGDLIMAIFGAPKGFGNDLENAARCALKMIEERRRLNETGKYKINIGIGVASGNVVAGRMGSKDRLNYTVLGPRVNLASRLCSKAGQMEVVIDDITFRSIENRAVVTPTPELQLKGFAAPVQAYKLEKFLSENESANKEMVAA